MESTLEKFYQPNDYDESVDYPKLKNGMRDPVAGLYDNSGLTVLNGDSDIKTIIS